MRQAIFLIIILSGLSVAYCQEGDTKATPEPLRIALKTDAFSWIFGTGVFKIERVINESLTFQLGGFYSWNYPAYDEEYFATGFAISPEIRFYLSKMRSAPRGVYLAPSYRYQKLDTENQLLNSESILVTNGIAISAGYQLVLKNIFVIDGWAGIAYNIRNVTEETIPGAEVGYNSENGVGVRIGVAIGLAF